MRGGGSGTGCPGFPCIFSVGKRRGSAFFGKILFISNAKEDYRKQRGKIIRDRLCCGEHRGGVKNSAENEQNGNVKQSLAADGQNQGGNRSAGGLDGVDEDKQKSHYRSRININACKSDAVPGSVRIVQKCQHQRTGPEIADGGHNKA